MHGKEPVVLKEIDAGGGRLLMFSVSCWDGVLQLAVGAGIDSARGAHSGQLEVQLHQSHPMEHEEL
jgi:hypothetical protein